VVQVQQDLQDKPPMSQDQLDGRVNKVHKECRVHKEQQEIRDPKV
jgi:hypothetical protein